MGKYTVGKGLKPEKTDSIGQGSSVKKRKEKKKRRRKDSEKGETR